MAVEVRRDQQRFPRTSWRPLLSNLLAFLVGGWMFGMGRSLSNLQIVDNTIVFPQETGTLGTDILGIPQGRAIALPSIRIDEANVTYNRKIYGGRGDKPHLGGFTDHGVDRDGMSPALWKMMIDEFGVKSLLDVGCGRGVSTSWFHTHGVDVICVEGSHDAIQQTLLPLDRVVEHDFSRGPWWPPHTVDVAWTVEVLEHIGRNFHQNLLPSFRKAAMIFATHSIWGGWHHVETHDTEWWIAKMESFGFVYSKYWTLKSRKVARDAHKDRMPNGNTYEAGHIREHLMVFLNPRVASLPEHHHLFAEDGCYLKNENIPRGGLGIIQRECGTGKGRGTESVLPDSFKRIQLNSSMDEAWERLVFGKTYKEASAEPGFFGNEGEGG